MQFHRRSFARIALAVVVPAVLLLAAEAIARAFGFVPDSQLVVIETDVEHAGSVRLRALGISTDTPHVSPWFSRAKGPGTFRIAMFGESAAAGFPHSLSSTPARWLEALMAGRCDGRKIEVVDCAIPGIGSDWIEQAARRVIPLGVDLVLVYAGNNEFLSAFVERRRVESRVVNVLAARSALLCALLRMRSRGQALVATRSPLDTTGYLDEPLRALRTTIEERFGANLETIGALAKEAGAAVIFVRPVAARRDWPPQSSVPRQGLSPQDRNSLEAFLKQAGSALAARDANAARAAIDAATALDPDLALVHFQRGELFDLLSDSAAASVSYTRALDLDDRPSRVNAALAAQIVAAAKRGGGNYFDADAAFHAAGGGIAPSDWLDDHVHLSIEGQYHLALLLTDALRSRAVPCPSGDWKPSPITDFAAGVKALGIKLGEAIVSQVQLGFSSIIAGYEQEGGRSEHLARARRQFDRVLEEDPKQPRALCGRGLVAAAQGRADDAIADFDAAWHVAPRVPLEIKASVERFPVFATILESAGLAFDAEGRLVRK